MFLKIKSTNFFCYQIILNTKGERKMKKKLDRNNVKTKRDLHDPTYMRYKCFFFFFVLPLLKLTATHIHTHKHKTLSSFPSFSSYILSLYSPFSFSFSKSHINCSPPPYLPSIKSTLFPTLPYLTLLSVFVLALHNTTCHISLSLSFLSLQFLKERKNSETT